MSSWLFVSSRGYACNLLELDILKSDAADVGGLLVM